MRTSLPLQTLISYSRNPETETERWNKLIHSRKEQRYFSVPGRVEIVGNHTDHNLGKVLAASINLDVIVAARTIDSGYITVYSGKQNITIPLNTALPENASASAKMLKAMLEYLQSAGYRPRALEACCNSRVQIGQGLSSSASFCMALLAAICALSEIDISLVERARIAQNAEHSLQKPCGLMDQLACSHGGIIKIDFQNPSDPDIKQVSPKNMTLHPVIVYTGSGHANLSDFYASIPKDMQAVSAFFSKQYLRSVDETQFYKDLPALRKKLPDSAILRAMHFFAENSRVEQLASVLEQKNSDVDQNVLSIVSASGNSSWQLLQNVITTGSRKQELAVALTHSRRFFELHGLSAVCRVHGGGFTGSMLAFLPEAALPAYRQYMEDLLGSGCTTAVDIRPVGECEVLV